MPYVSIAPHEIATLEAHGIEKIYTPEDGRRLGLAGMIGDVMQRVAAVRRPPYAWAPVSADDPLHLGRTISVLEGAPVATGADGDAIARRRPSCSASVSSARSSISFASAWSEIVMIGRLAPPPPPV